jgi:hypothetical protein
MLIALLSPKLKLRNQLGSLLFSLPSKLVIAAESCRWCKAHGRIEQSARQDGIL